MRLQIRTVVIAVNKHASTCAQWGTVLSALGTLAALGVAYEAFSVQNAQLKEQIKTQAQATAEERERFLRQLEVQRKHLDQFVVAFQNQQSAALYTQANTTTRFLQDHPQLYDYFKRRPNGTQSAREHADMVKTRFQKASPEEQALVLIGTEGLTSIRPTLNATLCVRIQANGTPGGITLSIATTRIRFCGTCSSPAPTSTAWPKR